MRLRIIAFLSVSVSLGYLSSILSNSPRPILIPFLRICGASMPKNFSTDGGNGFWSASGGTPVSWARFSSSSFLITGRISPTGSFRMGFVSCLSTHCLACSFGSLGLFPSLVLRVSPCLFLLRSFPTGKPITRERIGSHKIFILLFRHISLWI